MSFQALWAAWRVALKSQPGFSAARLAAALASET